MNAVNGGVAVQRAGIHGGSRPAKTLPLSDRRECGRCHEILSAG